MSVDLKTQIRHLASQTEVRQQPVTTEEVRLRVEAWDGTEPIVGPIGFDPGRFPKRRTWPAVVAGVALLLLFAALAMLLPPGEPVPPADSSPSPEGAGGYYAVLDVPDGFVLQDLHVMGGGSVVYLREADDAWFPTDGGFSLHGVAGRPFGAPEDPDGYLDNTLEAVPGSLEVEVAGNRGVLHEVEFRQGGIATSIIWVLATDDRGGVFEVAAVGMSRDEVMAVAAGVQPLSVDEMLALGADLSWNVKVSMHHNGFGFAPPSRLIDLAAGFEVALGLDLLFPRLSSAGGDTTVVTTEDGDVVEVGEALGRAINSTMAVVYLEVDPEEEDAIMAAYPGSADLSPERRAAGIDRYVDFLSGGRVLSEDPYVVQAPPGPEPRFDVTRLGEELPLVPVTSADVIPESFFEMNFGLFRDDLPLATPDRPVVVIGSVSLPGIERTSETIAVVWFTSSGFACDGSISDGGSGSSCGYDVLRHFGQSGESYGGGIGEISYVVPLDAAVVQIVTDSQTFWQRPVGGYGLVPYRETVEPYGETVERPIEMIVFDADGDEIGRWAIESR
jgi:hypothetical protein